MSTAMHVLWTLMLFTGALMADIIHGRGFPVYMTALAAGVGAGMLVSALTPGTRVEWVEDGIPACQPGTGRHRRCVKSVPRQRDEEADAS